MAVPKRRTSKRKKRARNTHKVAPKIVLQACPLSEPEAAASRVRGVRVLRGSTAGHGSGSVTLARIALDAMGGDHAPVRPWPAVARPRELDNTTWSNLWADGSRDRTARRATVGDLAHLAPMRARVELVEAPDVIGCPTKRRPVRGKLQSSMVIGLRLQADGRSDAFVSAGNTGAQMAASKDILSLHPGLVAGHQHRLPDGA